MKLYIETVGCQMNELDSELVVASLRKDGYELTANVRDADTILFNTCSVRQHAEDKIYSALGRLKNAKREHPGQSHRRPRLHGAEGPGAHLQAGAVRRSGRRPGPVAPGAGASCARFAPRGGQRMEVSLGRKDGSREQIERSHESFDPLRDPAMRPTPYQAYVRIMIGCDKFCTYCIVPSVRGPEQSRPPAAILAEVAAAGRRRLQGNHAARPDGQQLPLPRGRPHVAAERSARSACTRSTASSGSSSSRTIPKDMTNDLLAAVRDLPKVSKYLHVPVQSGSNAVLQRMKRGYTVEEYREMLARMREWIPGVAVTSDFIVGFCGETDDDFQLTMDLVRESRFKNSFIFKYSERPGTKGAELYADDVPDDVKRRRNNELLALQNEISEADNQAFLGQQVTVLVEGPSKAAERHAHDESADSRQPTARQPDTFNSPAARIATGSSSSTATAARSATSCRSSSTTPTPTRCSAKSSRGTSGPELFTLSRPGHDR